jgi:hypothetical protein
MTGAIGSVEFRIDSLRTELRRGVQARAAIFCAYFQAQTKNK